MEIRLVKEEELKPLAKLYAEAFTEADPEKPWTEDRAYELLKHYFKIQPDLFFIAVENSDLLGMLAILVKPWRQGNRLVEGVIFVRSERQKQGVGKQLTIRVLEESLLKYQTESLESITFADKEFPLSWYKSIGLMPDNEAIFIKGNTREILENLKKETYI